MNKGDRVQDRIKMLSELQRKDGKLQLKDGDLLVESIYMIQDHMHMVNDQTHGKKSKIEDFKNNYTKTLDELVKINIDKQERIKEQDTLIDKLSYLIIILSLTITSLIIYIVL